MKEREKSNYLESAMQRVLERNKTLEGRIGELEDSLRQKEEELEEAEKRYAKLLQSYNDYLNDYAERIELLAETQAAYEYVLHQIKNLEKQRKADVDRYVGELKKQNRRR